MAVKLPEGITNNNRINVVSMLADYDESTSSSRPTTPSILTAFVTKALTESKGKSEVDESNTEKISINKIKKSKKLKKLNKTVKRKRKNKMKKLKENGLDSNVQNDGQLPMDVKEDNTTNIKKKIVKPKPVFDLAGNIITPIPVSLFPITTTAKSDLTPKSIEPVVTEGPKPETSTPSPDKIVHSLSSAGIPTTTPSRVPSETSLPSTTTQKEENNESTSLKPTIITKTQIDKFSEKSIKESVHNATKSDSKDVNIFINIVQDKKKKRKEKWKKKQARLLKCPAKDFRNSPDGYKCCLKSAKCFENLPEDLDETSDQPHNEDSNHVNSDTRACGQIDHALLCMSGVLAKPRCKATADIVNKDLKEELLMVNTFYKNHCSHSVHTTPPPISRQPGGQEGHGASSNTESSPVSAALFGGVAGGAILLLIVLIAVIVCIVRRKRSSNRPRDDKAVFQTQASTTSTRYKEFIRRNSDVYAEIDERHLQRSFRLNSESTFETTEDSGGSYPGRPLPNAPSEYTTEETNGYLTPRASKEELNKKGYDELSTLTLEDNSSAESYDKLTLKKLSSSQPTGNESQEKSTDVTEHNGDGDYITPNTNGPIQEKPTDAYHMYFVLEKQ